MNTGLVKQRILSELKPVRPLPSTAMLAAWMLLAAAVCIGAGTFVLGLSGWRAQSATESALIFPMLTVFAVAAAAMAARRMAPGTLRYLPLPRVAVGMVAVFAGVIESLFPYAPNSEFVPEGLNCLLIGSVTAAVTALPLVWIASKGSWLDRIPLAAATALLASLAGLTTLEFVCPRLESAHAGLWHTATILVSMAVGFSLAQIKSHGLRNFREAADEVDE